VMRMVMRMTGMVRTAVLPVAIAVIHAVVRNDGSRGNRLEGSARLDRRARRRPHPQDRMRPGRRSPPAADLYLSRQGLAAPGPAGAASHTGGRIVRSLKRYGTTTASFYLRGSSIYYQPPVGRDYSLIDMGLCCSHRIERWRRRHSQSIVERGILDVTRRGRRQPKSSIPSRPPWPHRRASPVSSSV